MRRAGSTAKSMMPADGILRAQASPIAGLLALGLSLLASLLAAACGGGTGAPLQVRDVAPDFTLTATNGSALSLSDYMGKKDVLLYFSMGYG